MSKDSKLSFEEALEKLEKASEKLESGDLSLEAAISEFEECIKLIGVCEDKLSCARQKVRILTKSGDGSVTDAPFIPSDSDET